MLSWLLKQIFLLTSWNYIYIYIYIYIFFFFFSFLKLFIKNTNKYTLNSTLLFNYIFWKKIIYIY
ncbi:MAG: hypothetical protein N7Q72_03310, partial [Spiroplasma sp. Tabriz.8]|nr:hypothetical protein [Spiroplasma sp. Tabriz.8]